MTSEILTPAVMEWAGRAAPGARVARCSVRPLTGGAVARQVDQVTLHLTGHREPLELVRKGVPAHEIAGLRAAQAVLRQATAIPELVAWGDDWLITPLAPGSPLAWGDAVPANLVDGLAATLLHGDVHPGNVLVHADRATLIDWGNSRIGPAALDLANLVGADSADIARYARTWQQLTGQALPGDAIELGYRWAGLQIPVQYLPWTTAYRPTRDVEAALDQIEQALGQL